MFYVSVYIGDWITCKWDNDKGRIMYDAYV
jgi:hypothetical protein